ncbi:hypothetical protein GL4_0390 [Methyloceanibacter caenitepidi]|uniref:Uncharacterized protein n=1 Tax=Methyloceanibacter caenitepidi TaxID=1384459 RepID=A0A0A8JYK0_9HYPH|nr:hypothetical protein GL4_0390 [Methyloceanibacter caenitepidi]
MAKQGGSWALSGAAHHKIASLASFRRFRDGHVCGAGPQAEGPFARMPKKTASARI